MNPKEEKLSTDAPMTATDEAGLACLLTDAEIRKGRAAIKAEFKQGVKAVKELPDGYELQFPGDPQWIRVLSAFIEYESADASRDIATRKESSWQLSLLPPDLLADES